MLLPEEKYNSQEEKDQAAQSLFNEGLPDSGENQPATSENDESAGHLADLEKKYEREISAYESHAHPSTGDTRKEFQSSSPETSAAGSGEQRSISKVAGQLSSAAHSHIKGWGIDADPSNDPTYPIKNRTNEKQLGNTWTRPPLQKQTVELLVSNERNNTPAVFASVNPPSGVSGMIKRKAFKYSESDYRHWLGLVLSDKIGVLEGKIDDIRHGIIPNPIAERGLKSEWKYNRKKFVTKTAVKTAVIGAAVGLILLSRKKKQKPGIVENLLKSL